MKRIGLLVALSLWVACSVQAQLNGVTAELKLDQDQYLPGEEVQLKVTVLNRSGQEITLGAENDWVTLSIVGENNLICSHLGDMPVKGEFSLISGEMGTRKLNPTPYFDFSRPGRYHIMAWVKIPQWQEQIACKPVSFTVADGIPLPNLADLQFGVPPAPGATNATPEVRRYSLLKISYVKELKLYFRLTGSTGKIMRVFPIANMTSFSAPEAQIDRYNNLHVLVQIGARAFSYCIFTPDGQWAARQSYFYSDTRPELRIDPEGKIYVGGGMRVLTAGDFPSPESARK